MGHALGVGVRAAGRFWDDMVRDPHLLQILGGHLESLSGLLGLAAVPPGDGGAAFGRDHAVDGILKHQNAVAHGNCQGPPAAAFSSHGHDNGNGDPRHLPQIARNGLGLPAFLGVDSGIRPGRIHEREDRPVELRRHAHDAQRLAISFRLGHPEVPLHFLLRVVALLVADDRHRLAVKPGHPGYQSRIVTKDAVAVEFREVLKEVLHIVESLGPLLVSRDLDTVPGGGLLPVERFVEPFGLAAQLPDAPLGVLGRGPLAQLLDFLLDSFQFFTGFFVVQWNSSA